LAISKIYLVQKLFANEFCRLLNKRTGISNLQELRENVRYRVCKPFEKNANVYCQRLLTFVIIFAINASINVF